MEKITLPFFILVIFNIIFFNLKPKDLISLTELSNVRLQHEVKVSSIEPKVVPMMFETPSSSTPYLFTSRIHEVR